LKGLTGAGQRGLPPLAARVKSYILQGHRGQKASAFAANQLCFRI
jgi:hypothetical protein